MPIAMNAPIRAPRMSQGRTSVRFLKDGHGFVPVGAMPQWPRESDHWCSEVLPALDPPVRDPSDLASGPPLR